MTRPHDWCERRGIPERRGDCRSRVFRDCTLRSCGNGAVAPCSRRLVRASIPFLPCRSEAIFSARVENHWRRRPLVVGPRLAVRLGGACVLLLLTLLLPHPAMVTWYLPLFACGIAGFQWFAKISGRWEAPLLLVPAAAILYTRMGAPVTAAGLAT